MISLSKLKKNMLFLVAAVCAISIATQPMLTKCEQTSAESLQASIRSLVIPSPIETLTKMRTPIDHKRYGFVNFVQKAAESYPVQEKQPEHFETLSQQIKALYALDPYSCNLFIEELTKKLASARYPGSVIADRLTTEMESKSFSWALYGMSITGMTMSAILAKTCLEISTIRDAEDAAAIVFMIFIGAVSVAGFADQTHKLIYGPKEVDQETLKCAKSIDNLRHALTDMSNYLESCLNTLNAKNKQL